MSVHRIGFTELSGIQGGVRDGPFRVNIIFVHGLRGHPQHTWEDSRDRGSMDRGNKDAGTATPRKRDFLAALFKSKPSSSASTSTSIADNVTSEECPNKLFWPDEYLTQDIPEARVWTYGYDADAIGWLFKANNKNSAMRRSEICRARTKLIIFLGTPHRGSAYAGWGEIALNLARLVLQDSNKKIIETLEVNSEVLDNIHEEFKTIADQSRIRIHSFQEAQGISGMKGLDSKVLLIVNSTAGCGRFLLEARSASIPRDGREYQREPYADGQMW
ncbi:hypothetical protein C8A05DRAFT_48388 [Staphylotrichum tortipilum]|uniref:Uncharacterized protein n=1 Tax=Staphylotrichum tortipilum TaxID=2831512 RepID=A0AAN6M984_9PEZI|nr:hypothetical protein C8A05DRAFT_48388 [Staphylotrichum longicolle]